MNRIKKELEQELQSITLSDEKKHAIVQYVKRKKHGIHKERWAYRFALLTFIIFSFSFGVLLIQQQNKIEEAVTTNESESTTAFFHYLASDWTKGVLLVMMYIVIGVFLKRLLRKKGKGLPVCIACGEEWTYREALKMSMKNEAVDCPYCAKKQYKTRKSSMQASSFTIFVPLGILIAQVFDHILLGYLLHVSGAIWLMLMFTPYLVEYQEEDPMIKPLY